MIENLTQDQRQFILDGLKGSNNNNGFRRRAAGDQICGLTPLQSRCSYSILHLKLFNFSTKNITKRPSETAKLHQKMAANMAAVINTEIFSKLGEQLQQLTEV